MKIIVEGADGSGKSTLVDTLSLKYNLDKHHIGNPKTKEMFNIEYELLLKALKENKIIDRFSQISETIYSKVFNRKPKLEFDITLPELMEYGNSWVIIFCITENTNPIKNKSYKSKEWYGEIENRKSLLSQEYIDMFNILKEVYPNNILSYNFSKDSLNKVYDFIESRSN